MEVTAVQQLIKKATEMSNQSGDSGFVGRSFLSLIANENSLQLEKQQIIEFGSKMQIIKDVDFDGNVTFIYDPEKHFNETYGKAN